MPPIWEDIVGDSYVLDIDDKLVGVRMNLSYDFEKFGIPYIKLMSAIIGKESDISEGMEITWSFPNFTITSGIIPVYPALYISGIPPKGITIISNKAIGSRVKYTETFREPFVWIPK